MPLEDIFAPSREYFQGLQQARTQQAYMRQLQQQQRLKDAIELFKATRTPPTKPIYDQRRGVLIDPNTGKVTNLGLPAAPPTGKETVTPAEKQKAISQILQTNPPGALRPLMERAVAPDADPALVDFVYSKALAPAYGASMYTERFLPQTGMTPTGVPTVQWFTAPARGGTPRALPSPEGAAPSGEGGGGGFMSIKPTAAQGAQLQHVNNAETVAGTLRDDVQALGDVSSGELARQYAAYRAPFGALGQVDPRYAAYFNDLGQLQTELIGSATQGNSRSIQLVNMLKQHIPDPWDPPQRALEKLSGFEKGRFAAIRNSITAGGVAAPSGAGAAVSKQQSLADRGYVKLPDGTWYNPTTNKYDDGK